MYALLFTDAPAANVHVENPDDTTEIFRQPEDEVPVQQTRKNRFDFPINLTTGNWNDSSMFPFVLDFNFISPLNSQTNRIRIHRCTILLLPRGTVVS